MEKFIKNIISFFIAFALIFGCIPTSILNNIDVGMLGDNVFNIFSDFFNGIEIKAEAATLESVKSGSYDIFSYTLCNYSDGTKEIHINSWAYADEVIIPEEINGIPVTALTGFSGFNCKKVTIPNTIEYITTDYASSKAEEVYFNGTLEEYLGLFNKYNSYIFKGTYYDLYINGELAVDITIPDTVSKIGYCTFEYCKSLKSIRATSNLEIIFNAFRECINLEAALFEGGGNCPDFRTCINLKKICVSNVRSDIIPNTVTELIISASSPYDPYYQPSSVPYVLEIHDFPYLEKFTYLGDEDSIVPKYFIDNCPMLKEVCIGNNIKEIEMPFIRDCKSLETISVPFLGTSREATEGRFIDIFEYDYSRFNHRLPISLKNIHITDDKSIPAKSFYDDREGTTQYPDGFFATIYIHGDIESIGSNAFAYYKSTTKNFGVDIVFVNSYTEEELLNRKPGTIKFPKSLINIDSGAFYKNTDIDYVYFNANIRSTGGFGYNGTISFDYEEGIVYLPGFPYCEGITELYIPPTVEYIGSFNGCPDLVDVVIASDKIKNLTSGTFSDTPYFENHSYYFEGAFLCIDLLNGPCMVDVYYKVDLFDSIPEGIVSIAPGAGDFKAGQRDPDEMFVIADSVVNIGDSAFEGNYYDEGPYIYNLFLGENVEYIGDYCFENQWELTNVYMNKNIKYIGTNAFYYTPKFSDLYYYGSPEEFDKIEKNGNDFSKKRVHYYYRPDIASVSVISKPTKKTYFKGELFDLTGLKVKVTYADGTSKIIIKDLEECCYGFSGAVGVNTITVDIGGVTCTFDVTVNEVLPVELTVLSLPSKLEYNLNEEIDLTGLKLQVTYNDGHVMEISQNFTCDTKVFNSLGVHTVTITYSGLSITFEVNVIVGENHEHSYDLIYLLKDPTCVDSGLLCYECYCGDYFVEDLEPLGHDLTDVWTYSSNGVFIKTCSTCSLPYESKIVTLSFADDNVELTNMQSLQLKATTTDNFDWSVSWFSSDPTIVSVDYLNGKITANNVGVAEITAKLNGTDVQAVCTVTVNPRSFYVSWIVDDKIERYSIPEGEKIIEIEPPTKNGYTFLGWTPEVPEFMPSNNLIFTAVWQQNNYEITWIIDDNVIVDSYVYGEEIKIPVVQDKPGFTFYKWSDDIVETMPDYNLEYVAIWKPNVHNVSFVVNGEIYDSIDCAYSEEIVQPEPPQMQGYTFVGWTPSIPETMPDIDLTFTAVFELTTYTASFVADGTVISTQQFTIQTEHLNEPPVPQKAGYYACWSRYEIVASDITIVAKYYLPEVVMVSKHTLDVGDTYRLLPSCNFEVTDKSWKSSDTSVATINQNGKVTAVGEGECRVTVTCYGKDSLGNDVQASKSTKIIVNGKSETTNIKQSFREMFDEFFEVTLHDLLYNLRQFLIVLFRYAY